MISTQTFLPTERFVVFLLLWGNVILVLSHDPELSSQRLTEKENTDASFGVLHTLQRYALWAAKEERITEVLTERLRLIDIETKIIQSYLSDYNESSGEALRNLVTPRETPEERGEVIGSSAILGHRMTKRYASEIYELRNLLDSSDYLTNLEKLSETLDLGKGTANPDNYFESVNGTVDSSELADEESRILLVGWQDLYMSMTTFLHNMDIYQYKPEDILEGVALETNYGGRLHAIHCAELGMFALFKIKYYASVEWLELAIMLLESYENEDVFLKNALITVDPSLVKSLYSLAVQQHNRMFYEFLNDDSECKTGDHERFFNFYINPMLKNDTAEERLRYREDLYWNYKGVGNNTQLEAQFMDLCMGNVAQPPEVQKKLKCYYEQRRHPYLFINPVKVEHLSESPPVFQFYELVGNRTIELINEMQMPLVTLSQLVGTSGVDSITVFRTSAGVGMPQDDTPAMVYNLAEYVTGLNIRGTSEHVQFVEYSYGRYYDYHTDAFEEDDEAEVANGGDRVATVLYYLEVPPLGGLTPFCQAGVFAHPARGSAVFWYNMHRNGTARKDTQHGACPVIHGHKIIMNHWIRYNGNWNTFKCSLNQFE